MKLSNNLDFSQLQILNAVIQNLAAAPSSPVMGQIYYNTTSNVVQYWDGGTWVSLTAPSNALTLGGNSGAYYLDRTNHTGTQTASTISNLAATVKAYRLDEFAAPTSALSLGTQRLVSVADPTSNQDAATKIYVDTQIANLINSAPGALNTLNELAAALGNDPNFATTIVSQINSAKDRANHTGTQLASTISDFTSQVNTLISTSVSNRSWSFTIGDGTATVFTSNYPGSKPAGSNPIVQVYRNSSPYDMILTDVEAGTTALTLRFAKAPTANEYKVVVMFVG